MKKYLNKLVLAIGMMVVLVVTLLSCNDDILDIPNTNALDTSVIGIDQNVTQGLVNGMYAPLQSVGMHGRWINLIKDGLSDEGDTPSNQIDISRISNYLLDGSNSPVQMLFQACFQGVNRANTILDNIENMSFTEDINNDFIGQAYFMRAHYYFELATLFGDVPLTLSAQDPALPLSSARDIFDQLITDLEKAALLLPEKSGLEEGRPSNESAYAYLGKALLFRGDLYDIDADYTASKNAFDKVISYSLEPNFIDNFNISGEYNDESLFEVGFIEDAASEQGTWVGSPEFSNEGATAGAGVAESSFRANEYSGWGTLAPEAPYVTKFDLADPRTKSTFFFQGDSFGTGQFTWGARPEDPLGKDSFGLPGDNTRVHTVKKYSNYIEKDYVTINVDGINQRQIRFADVLLMKAEAEAKRPGGSIATAMRFVNQVRARVSMPPLMATDMNSFMDVIIQERVMELSYEGKRFVDLKRWKIDFEVLNPINPNYTLDEQFLPIPDSELQSNPNF